MTIDEIFATIRDWAAGKYQPKGDYVATSGGKMTGDLILKRLAISDGTYNRVVIQLYDGSTETANLGSEMLIGAKGNTFIGSGEGYNALYAALSGGETGNETYSRTGERFYMTSDAEIFLCSNCQTVGDRKTVVFDRNGILRPIVSGQMSLGSANYKWLAVHAEEINGDTAGSTVSFTSPDALDPAEWTDVEVVTDGETHTSLFAKISTMIKNVRYIWKLLGSTDISAIGDGTVTGAISSLNDRLTAVESTADN